MGDLPSKKLHIMASYFIPQRICAPNLGVSLFMGSHSMQMHSERGRLKKGQGLRILKGTDLKRDKGYHIYCFTCSEFSMRSMNLSLGKAPSWKLPHQGSKVSNKSKSENG